MRAAARTIEPMKNTSGLISTMARIDPPLTAAIIVDPTRTLDHLQESNPQRAEALRKIAIESPHIPTEGDEPNAGSALLHEASDAFAVIGNGGGDLTEGQQASAEAVIMLFGRPAIQFDSGRLQEIPDEWRARLRPHRTAIQSLAKSVCRIEPAGLPNISFVGTAFVVGPDIVMTNRHVAKFISSRAGGTWTIKAFAGPRVDFRAENPTAKPLEFELEDVLSMSDDDDIDLALLKIAPHKGKLPAPVPLASRYRPKTGSPVYVVGHPAFDESADPAQRDIQRLVFDNVFDVKRVAPGYLLASATDDLAYDSSTLGGNSGSCVVDLETGTVIGLHFGGTYLEANYAEPLWKLKRNKLVRRFGLNYVS